MFSSLSLQTVIHVIVALAFPPFLLGVINRVKAIFGGRRGQPLVQAYYDLWKLMHKDSVISQTTTWVFLAGPIVGIVSAVLVALMIPLGHPSAPLAFVGDVVLAAYLLGLGRFFTMGAALDTGSAFEGMGSAREATYACLAEPILFVGFLVLVKLTGAFSLTELLGPSVAEAWSAAGVALLLIVVSWFIITLVENSRIPFDDPNTHLELTMIHEVMVLDHSGPAFGMILYGASIKLFVFAALLVRLTGMASSGNAFLDWGIFLGGTILVACLIGVVESAMARLRLPTIPAALVGAGVVAFFGFLLVLIEL